MTMLQLTSIESILKPQLALINIDFSIFQDEYEVVKFSLKSPPMFNSSTGPHAEVMIPSSFSEEDLLQNISDLVKLLVSNYTNYIWLPVQYKF